MKEMNVVNVEIVGDSQLVINQLAGTFKCSSWALAPYFATASQLLGLFDDVVLKFKPRDFNKEANELAQLASGLKIGDGFGQRTVLVEKRVLPSIRDRGLDLEVMAIDPDSGDWRTPIMIRLVNPGGVKDRKLRLLATQFVMYEGELYKKSSDGLLLRCLGKDEAMLVMAEVHEGIVVLIRPG